MILALVLALTQYAYKCSQSAYTVPSSVAEPARLKKPFIVQWEVKWKAPLAPTGHSKRFAKAEDAVRFELAAPMCKTTPEPCVAWIHTSVYTFDPRVQICALK